MIETDGNTFYVDEDKRAEYDAVNQLDLSVDSHKAVNQLDLSIDSWCMVDEDAGDEPAPCPSAKEI